MAEMKDVSSKMSAFAKELDTAFQQRRIWLIERGYAELCQHEQKTSIIYKRGYLKALEAEVLIMALDKVRELGGKEGSMKKQSEFKCFKSSNTVQELLINFFMICLFGITIVKIGDWLTLRTTQIILSKSFK